MAGASLLTLIDDIASILDDISVMTQTAAKKTAGVLGDDLALNAQQVAGVRADRELTVVWAVAKGSTINKLILVPIALLINALFPMAVTPLLMLGGLFLCFEGVEKLVHPFLIAHKPQLPNAVMPKKPNETAERALESAKIKGAIRTDFVLSAEIIVITLGTVAHTSFVNQVTVLFLISAIMTIGVYGLVAGIVKLDDAGLFLTTTCGLNLRARFARSVGFALLRFAPYMMKTLSIVGTIAMFLVGGAIVVHGIAELQHAVQLFASHTNNAILSFICTMALEGLVGVLAGMLVFVILYFTKPALSAILSKVKHS